MTRAPPVLAEFCGVEEATDGGKESTGVEEGVAWAADRSDGFGGMLVDYSSIPGGLVN